ncbi:MAG: DNA translocase FtsK, partial [Acholeplasmatales bacterium]|nr:DNA translocase FtsK [Acholeplasmatales bacterium]
YDYARNKEDKHISDEELIKRHGTKYYEFTILNKDSVEEIKAGSEYNKPKPKEVEKVSKTKMFSFIEDEGKLDDIKEEAILEQQRQEEKVTQDYNDSEAEFKLNIELDDKNYDYNTYDDEMPKPEQANIPSFLSKNPLPKKENYNLDMESSIDDSNLEFDVPKMDAPEIEFDNPAIDRNQTIEEAISRMKDNNFKFSTPTVTSNPVPPKVEEKQVYKSKYEDYSIPYEKIFKKSAQSSEDDEAFLTEKKEVINRVLHDFDIDGEVVNYTRGPAFTRYEIGLAPGVNVKKVNSIYNNLQLDLQTESLRLLSPIPGKNTIGIEVPNEKREIVSFGDLVNEDFINDGKPLNVALGKNIDGSLVYKDITKMPHCLIAGATKSGKSVSINTIIISLLIKNSPEDLKLILVDPKKVEFSFYNDIPHLATPIIDDPQMAAEALKWAVEEMDRRYEVFARNRVRNLEGYNEKRKLDPELEKLPYYVIIIDEFNDLIMQCANDVNYCVLRLAQKARAAGMHVILATQRPTTDVVNGTIKANFPCRIAFRVSSDLDSRVILDEQGAESLLGNGDMLIKTDQPLQRAQGAYISDDEIGAVADFLVDNYDPDFVFSHEELTKKVQQAGGVTVSRKEVEESDDLLYEIASACVQQGTCSINSIQSSFGLGFNRAQRIVTILEDRGVVSPKNGTKGREILVDIYELNKMFGKED